MTHFTRRVLRGIYTTLITTLIFAGAIYFVGTLPTQVAESSHMQSGVGSSFVRFTKTGIDATAAASTLIGTTDNAKFVPTQIVFTSTAVSGSVTVASASVGTNSSSYNNLLAITALTGLTSADLMLSSSLGGTALGVVAANTGIYVKVTTGAVASGSTVRIDIIGYYQ